MYIDYYVITVSCSSLGLYKIFLILRFISSTLQSLMFCCIVRLEIDDCDVCSRLLTPVEALVSTDAVSSLQDHRHHHHHQQQQQLLQQCDSVDVLDTASSIDDAASEMSDEEAASVIEVEVGRTDYWSSADNDHHQLTTGPPSSNIPTSSDSVSTAVQWSAVSTDHVGPPTLSSLPSNDDSELRRRTEYIQTAPWRCLPIKYRASFGSYSDPDIASSAAADSDFERQRLARARQRRHLARSTDVSQSQLIPNKSASSSSSTAVTFVRSVSVTSTLQPTTTTAENDNKNNNNKLQQQLSRNSYVPQKPPPPLPMPENELVKQLRPVHNNDVTTKPSSSSSSSSSSSLSSVAREKQIPVRELVAQLSGQTPATTTAQTAEQQQQQQRRQQRRHQLQLLHGRPLSSSSSDAEADYEIFINTPPAAAAKRDDDNQDDKSVSSVFLFYAFASE